MPLKGDPTKMRDQNKRTVLIEAVIAGGLIAIGFTAGQVPLLTLAAAATSVGCNWTHSLAERGFQHWRGRWFTNDGVLNKDITKVLCHAFEDTVRQLEHDWKHHRHYQYLQHKSSEKAQLTLDALRMLREDGVNLFQQPDHLTQISQHEQHNRVLSLLYQDDFKASEYLKPALGDFLHGHDDELVTFVTEQLGPKWIARFLESLKGTNEEGTRAWRACQLLWQQSLMLGIDQIQQAITETADTVRWLQEWAQKLKSQPPTERNSIGQDALEEILHSVHAQHAQLGEIQAATGRLETKLEQVEIKLEQVYQEVAPADQTTGPRASVAIAYSRPVPILSHGSDILLGPSNENSIAREAISTELLRLSSHVKAVHRTWNATNPNGSNIEVTLHEDSVHIIVQPMAMNGNNLHLQTVQMLNWLDSPVLVVPIWWNESHRAIYWTDLSRYLFSGLLTRGTKMLYRQSDLHRLDTRDVATVKEFFQWVSIWSKAWPKLYFQSKNDWLLDIRFPAAFLDVVRQPDILQLLPLNTQLVTLLENVGNQERDRHQIIMDIISAGTQAQSSPEHAIEKLLNQYGVIRQESRLQIVREFSYWLEQIAADREPNIARTLRALNHLFSLLSYEKSGLLRLPPFASIYTFPLGRLVSLLPPDIAVEPLRAILNQHNDPDVLRHAAYNLGSLNIPLNDHIWKDMHKLRQKVFARRAAIGEKQWPLVDRQLLYTEAQLGGGEANAQFIRALRDNDALHFELAYNFMYYGGNRQLIQRQIEHRLGERRRTDRFVDNILQTGYNHFWKHRDNWEIFSKLDPKLWPAPVVKM